MAADAGVQVNHKAELVRSVVGSWVIRLPPLFPNVRQFLSTAALKPHHVVPAVRISPASRKLSPEPARAGTSAHALRPALGPCHRACMRVKFGFPRPGAVFSICTRKSNHAAWPVTGSELAQRSPSPFGGSSSWIRWFSRKPFGASGASSVQRPGALCVCQSRSRSRLFLVQRRHMRNRHE